MYDCGIFFLIYVAKDTTSYYVTIVWSCNITLLGISVQICQIDTPLLHSHRYGLPLLHH